MASTYLTRAFSSNTSSTKATWSFWVKFSKINGPSGGASCMLFQARNANNSNAYRTYIRYGDAGTLDFIVYNGSGSVVGEYYTTRVLRDCNSWYHICYSIDTTLNTASDRLKLYINGVRETDFDSSNSTILAQNEAVKITSSVFTDISRNGGVNNNFLDGLLSHYILTDGYVYQADTFGSTDTTTGEWKINPSPTISNWGSNGFWILKDGNSVTDSSPNSNTFTVGAGTLSKSEDCPSNVFATMNPLDFDYANADTNFTNGNTFVMPAANANYNYGISTMAMPKGNGKFYFEAKYVQYDSVEVGVGIVNIDYASDIFYQNRRIMQNSSNTEIGRVLLNANGRSIIPGTENSSYGFGSFSNGDIICMACDMENGAFYFRKNDGSWANSGNPESGSTKTGAIDISATSQWTSSSNWGVWCGDNEANYDRFAFNFGNGYFQTTAVSSAGTNASGNGIFEFNVPAGYTALSTKGLNL